MAKRRIYDIAKERGLTSQEVLERLRAVGVDAKSIFSTVEESDVERAFVTKQALTGTAASAPTATGPETSPAARSQPMAGPVSARQTGPAAAPQLDKEIRSPAGGSAPDSTKKATSGGAAKVESRPASPPADQGNRPPGAAGSRGTPQGEELPDKRGEAPGAVGGRSEGPRPAPSRPGPRKPPRPRGRGPRLEDLPTVVGPGVPLRKGVKPPEHVVSKEELARLQAEKAAKAEKAAQMERAAKMQKGGPGEFSRKSSGSIPRVPKPEPVPLPPNAGPRPAPAVPSRAHRPPGREPSERRERSSRLVEPPMPDVWAEVIEQDSPLPAGRAAGPLRVRRGENKPTKRRVIIDSQAGRKTGKGGLRDHRAAPGAAAEAPAVKKKAPPGTESPVKVKSGASVKDLSEAFELSASELIKTLLKLGEMVTITQSLSDEAVLILAEEFDRQVEIEHAEEEEKGPGQFVDDPADLVPRAPVVTIMGHVDHGKTSLLDAIRETEVAKSEAGGITQHIGAYQVTHDGRKVTFLDTPGHEAFTAMRARGAKVTDIAVIVVAANDGVMPQTLEAINHAKAAGVPIVVAINKMDLPDANPDLVKKQLSDQGLVPEAWGGDTVTVEVSAKQRLNLDELMEMILLVAEVQELKANPKAPASGVVIEAQLDVGRGPVATILVQRGTLRIGDALVSGEAYGKVKAMFDFMGSAVTQAGPSMPVQVLGFNTPPVAGDYVMVVRDEREARQRAEQRAARLRQEQLAKSRAGAGSLEEFYRRLKEGRVKELPLIIKGDVAGSVEALQDALGNVSRPEVKVEVIHAGVGGINESDIMLAAAAKAVVIGFNVRPSAAAKALAEQEQVDVRTYRVIYKAIEDVEAALIGMLEPEHVEEEVGTAEVRQVFRASRVGTIAGCFVLTGKLSRSAKVRLVREGQIVYEGNIASLRRFADDVREVLAGYECGLHLDGYDDVRIGDVIEAYEIKEVARTR